MKMLRYHSYIFLKELKQTTKILRRDRRNSNPVHKECDGLWNWKERSLHRIS
jgi:hypothetical protein